MKSALVVLLPMFLVTGTLFSRTAPATQEQDRFHTDRESPRGLPLPSEDESFHFTIFGDRTGGPAEGVKVLAQAVADTNALGPDLVMTVGDLIEGYNQTADWLPEMEEYRSTMSDLSMPWFPVAGNHDVYWRGSDRPAGEHEANYEEHFGPLWYAFEHKGSWFVVLYSDEGDPEAGDKSIHEARCQQMSEEQFAWLDRTLQEAAGADHVFVFLHHPRWLGGDSYGEHWNPVHDRLVSAGNVTAVFAGHIHHMRYEGARDGIEYFTLATTGGSLSRDLPEVGFLHHFHVVTVRQGGIDVAAVPVGQVFDARTITGELTDMVQDFDRNLSIDFPETPGLRGDRKITGYLAVELTNPVERELDVQLSWDSAQAWRFAPDHSHGRVPPHSSREFLFEVERNSTEFDGMRLPTLHLTMELLTESARIPVTSRSLPLPVNASRLVRPEIPPEERVLSVDGENDYLSVASDQLAMPDGPLTVEGWLRATRFPDRAGFLTKTENSDFGLFVGEGRPAFVVHLDGEYVTASVDEAVLEPGHWHHLAGVFDGDEVRLYVDGSLVAATPGSGLRTMRSLPFLIGADVNSRGEGTSLIPGQIDEVRVSHRARYQSDFVPARRLREDSETALLLHMDDSQGPWMFDSSAHRAHPMIQGNPSVIPASADDSQ